MTEMILDVQMLPETIFSKITTKKVKLFEENGTITLTPFPEEKPGYEHLIGMFSNTSMSVDDFLEEKHKDLELEI
jgi:hypothetical protein